MTMRLIVTRPIEDAAPLKRKLEAMGHEVILSPLLDIVPVEDAVIPDRPFQLVAFTSANGVRALAGFRHLPAFAVGPQSADAARQAGFGDVTMAGGDAVGLADHIARHCDPKAGAVLYPSGSETAGDFAGHLSADGFEVARLIIYEARPAAPPPGVACGAEGVLLYSPRTARLWHAATKQDAAARRLIHFCLSENVAAALPEAHVKRIAASPTEESMLALIAAADREPEHDI